MSNSLAFQNLSRTNYITENSIKNAEFILTQACTETPPETFLKIGAVILLRGLIQKKPIKAKVICALANQDIGEWLMFLNSKFARVVADVVEKLMKLEQEIDLPGMFSQVHDSRAASTEVVLKYLGKIKDQNEPRPAKLTWVFNYNSTEKPLTAAQVKKIQAAKIIDIPK